jgi:hypothetical protein
LYQPSIFAFNENNNDKTHISIEHAFNVTPSTINVKSEKPTNEEIDLNKQRDVHVSKILYILLD